MPDIFVSYARAHEPIARWVGEKLTSQGYCVVLGASPPARGKGWSDAELEALRGADVVVFLVGDGALDTCRIHREPGRPTGAREKLPPLIWDVAPRALPHWARRLRAVNLTGRTEEQLVRDLSGLARRMSTGRKKATVVAVFAMIAAFRQRCAQGDDCAAAMSTSGPPARFVLH